MPCLAYVPPFKQPSIMLAPFLTSHAATSQLLHSSVSILLFTGSTIYLSPGTYTEGVHQNVPSIRKSLHNYKIKNQFKDFTKQSRHSHCPGPSTLQSLTHFRSLSENIMLLGLSGPNFITHLYQTPAIEWCVVRCESKKGHQKDILCLKEIGPLCSKFASYSRFDSQHNWEGIYGRLRRESSLLKMNKSSLYKLRELLWRQFGFAHHCVFIILLNVR